MGQSISAKLLFIPIALAVLAGCGSSFDWKGTWVGDRGYKAKMGEDPGIAGTASKVSITITGDNTFTAVDGGIAIEGDTTADGDRLILKPIRVMGAAADRTGPPFNTPMLLQHRPDGTATLGHEGKTDSLVIHRT